jgi:hypothetical protein
MWPLNVAQVSTPAAVLSGLAAVWWLLQDLVPKAPAVVLVLTAWVSGKSLVAVVTALYALHDAAEHDEALSDSPPAGRKHDTEAHAVAARVAARTGITCAQAPASPNAWWADWRFVATIGITNLVSLLNYRASLFLVEHFHGLKMVGTYSVSVTVAELLWLLSSSVTVSAYSRIGHPDRSVASNMTVQAVRINVLATLLAAPVLLGLAWWGLPTLMGPDYTASLMPLAVLMPGVAAYAAASSLSAFYTNHLGRPELSGRIAGLSLLISFASGCVLVPLWGATGAALASSLGYTLAIMAAYGVFLRHAGLPLRALWAADAPATPSTPSSAPH